MARVILDAAVILCRVEGRVWNVSSDSRPAAEDRPLGQR